MPIQNIGLAGRAGSGKGVLAAELVKRGYAVVSFANPVKAQIGELVYRNAYPALYRYEVMGPDGLPDMVAFCNEHKEAFRPMLQAYGAAMREIVGPNFWIDQALEAVNRFNVNGSPCVIDDVRYPNEVAALKAAGFVTVRIERPHWHRTLYGGNTLTGEQATHSSEAQIDDLDVDHCLDNQTTPESLLRKLDHYLRGVHAG